MLALLPYFKEELKAAWLAVVAVDENLTETYYTQNCSVAHDFCVAAPGGGSIGTGILARGQHRRLRQKLRNINGRPICYRISCVLDDQVSNSSAAQIATRTKKPHHYRA